jgi:hypothetical protein
MDTNGFAIVQKDLRNDHKTALLNALFPSELLSKINQKDIFENVDSLLASKYANPETGAYLKHKCPG